MHVDRLIQALSNIIIDITEHMVLTKECRNKYDTK